MFASFFTTLGVGLHHFSSNIIELNASSSIDEDLKDPGELVESKMSMKRKILDKGSELFQSFGPINSIHTHLCGLHGYSNEMHRQVRAHHFCIHLSDHFQQCLIFDSPEPNARLIGIEYVISEELYKRLPRKERKFWHSHVNEVKGGSLTCPGIPALAEHAFMEHFVKTYGKTFHTWQIDKHNFPFGIPKLMMSFTESNQISPKSKAVLEEYTKRKFEDIKKEREDIEAPPIHPDADGWTKGKSIQLTWNYFTSDFENDFD